MVSLAGRVFESKKSDASADSRCVQWAFRLVALSVPIALDEAMSPFLRHPLATYGRAKLAKISALLIHTSCVINYIFLENNYPSSQRALRAPARLIRLRASQPEHLNLSIS